MRRIEKEAKIQRKKSMSKKALKDSYNKGRITTVYRTCHVAHSAATDYNRNREKSLLRKELAQ